MKVSLVSVTAPRVAGIQSAEELIVYCARVSSPQNQANTETAPKLLRYCIRKRHWSIFEQASLCVEVETSRAIAAQLLRHWSLCFQEFSLRYAEASLGFEIYAARLQGQKNRQAGGSPEDVPGDAALRWLERQERHYAACEREYQEALKDGIARELARMLLPLATRSRLYINGAVRDWIHYLTARTAEDAQWEHREIAEAIQRLFAAEFPNIAAALWEE